MEITVSEFEKTLNQTISRLPAGNSITVNYNSDNQLTCLSKGKKLFEMKDVDGAIALEVQLFLETHSFHINNYRVSPYAYEAVLKKNKLPAHKLPIRRRTGSKH